MSRKWQSVIDDFVLFLQLNGFEPEVRFPGLSGKRRWRFDFFNAEHRLALEYNGKGVGHQGYAAVDRDYEKANEAQLCGITVIQCSATLLEAGKCHEWVESAMKEDA